MNATAAPSASPPWAVTAWCDDTRVFIELPSKAGPPHVVAYDKTAGGLGQALLLMHRTYNGLRDTLDHSPPAAPQPTFDPRHNARMILKRRGMIR